MKKILLSRHAKSSWDNPEWTDIERPLNERGLRDALKMSSVVANLLEKKPDLIVSSPALRAYTTCKYYADAFKYPQENIRKDINIFERGPKYVVALLQSMDDQYDFVALFGHNPDMTSLFAYFTGDYVANIPTGGVFCVEFDIESWKDIDKVNGNLIFFEYPKKHFPKDRFEFD